MVRKIREIARRLPYVAKSGSFSATLTICLFMPPRVCAQTPRGFEFDIASMESTPYAGDIAYVELTIENTSFFNTSVEAPRPYDNAHAFWRGGEKYNPSADLYVEAPLDPLDCYGSAAIGPMHPGQHCSMVAMLRVLKGFNAQLENEVDNKPFRFTDSSEQSIDIVFSQSIQVYSGTPALLHQTHRLVYRVPSRESVIVGDFDISKRELAELHDGDQRRVRWSMFPDFANRYAKRELLKPESNLARLHDFSSLYDRASKAHADSPGEFIAAIERVIDRMHPLERRWLILQTYQNLVMRFPRLQKAFLERFEPRRFVVN